MRKLFILLIAVLITTSVFAQIPEKMSYQAVIRSGGLLVTSQDVGVRISILKGSNPTRYIYEETHLSRTNENGLVSLEIGTGTTLIDDFTAIDWTNGPYFIKTETDPTGGTNYTIEGTSQLMSVPYALYAKTASSINGFTVKNNVPENAVFSDDQIAREVHFLNITSGLEAVNVQEAIDETDAYQKNQDLAINFNTKKIGIPTGGETGQVLQKDNDGYIWVNQTRSSLGQDQADAITANTKKIGVPTGGEAGQVLKTDGSDNYTWVDQTVDTDDQTATDVTVDADAITNLEATTVQAALEELQGDITSDAGGDMKISVYDTDEDDIVDNAATVTGFTVGVNVPAEAVFTDTQTAADVTVDADAITNLEATTVQAALEELQGDITTSNEILQRLEDLTELLKKRTGLDNLPKIGEYRDEGFVFSLDINCTNYIYKVYKHVGNTSVDNLSAEDDAKNNSGWKLPSGEEMKQISDNFSIINEQVSIINEQDENYEKLREDYYWAINRMLFNPKTGHSREYEETKDYFESVGAYVLLVKDIATYF